MTDVAELGIKISTQSVEAAGKKLAGFAATAAKAAVAATVGFSALIIKQMQLIDDQADLAKSLDSTYKTLANLKRASDLGGVSFEKLTANTKFLERAIGEAIGGSEAQVKAFKELGLEASELARLPLDERIIKINEAFEKNVDGARKASIAMDVYGRDSKSILMLNAETMREAAKQADILGVALSDIDVEKVQQANDSFSTIATAADGLTKQLTAQLAPILNQIGIDFLDAAENAGGMEKVASDLKSGLIPVLGITADGVAFIARGFSLAAHSAAGLGLALQGNNEILELMRLKAAAALKPWEKGTPAGAAAIAEIAAKEKQVEGTRSALEFSKSETERLLAQPYTAASDAMNEWLQNAEVNAKKAADIAVAERKRASDEKKAQDEINAKRNKAVSLQEEKAKLAADEQKYLDSITAQEIESWNARMDKEKEAIESLKESLLTEEQAIAASYEKRRQIVNDAVMVSGEEKLQLIKKLDEQEQAEKTEREMAAQAQQLENYGNLFESLHGMYEAYGKENSKTARVLFALSKAAAIGQAMLSISAAAKALGDADALTTTQRVANSAIIAGQVAAIVGTVKSVSMPSGQAHDGIMSVPKSGTWNLEKGERVTTAKTSAALDKTLAGIGRGGANVKIINSIDPMLIRDFLASDAGEEVIMNTISRNQSSIRSYSGA